MEPLEATAQEIRATGGTAHCVELNIREEEQVDSVVAAIVAEHGPIHGLVNNAGGQFASPAVMIKPKGWRAVVDTNLNGTFFMSQAVFKHSMSQHGGSIVNIVADMWNGFPGMAHTGAARAGVVNLTKTLAIEWGPAGVRVNSVAPGLILSSGMNNYPPHVLKMVLDIAWQNPASRMGSESEVSSAVAFLLSEAAAYVSGETVKVDGAASLAKANLFPLIKHDKSEVYQGFHLAADLPDALKD
jgi:citronellol/citronellal dehydrogenase